MKKHCAGLFFSVCFILAFITGCSPAAASSTDNTSGSESGTQVTQPENNDSEDSAPDPDESADSPDASDHNSGSDPALNRFRQMFLILIPKGKTLSVPA